MDTTNLIPADQCFISNNRTQSIVPRLIYIRFHIHSHKHFTMIQELYRFLSDWCFYFHFCFVSFYLLLYFHLSLFFHGLAKLGVFSNCQMALQVEEVDVIDIRKELFVIHPSFHHETYVSESFVLQFIEEEQTFGISIAYRLPPYLHKVSGILRLLPVL